MSRVLNHSRAVGTDKVVLLGIANHDGDGGAWPAIATLARYANVSERAVQKSIARLVESGELQVIRNGGGTGDRRGDRRPNLYRITVTDGVNHTSPRDAHGVNLGTARGELQDAHGVNHSSPKPSLEPSTEPSLSSSDADATDTVHEQGGLSADGPPPALALVQDAGQSERLAALLADLIVANGATKRPAVTDAWVRDLERMHRLDGVSWESIEGAIRWAQADPFWRANILSPRKLREKFNTLRLQASRPATAAAPARESEVAASLRLAAMLREQDDTGGHTVRGVIL